MGSVKNPWSMMTDQHKVTLALLVMFASVTTLFLLLTLATPAQTLSHTLSAEPLLAADLVLIGLVVAAWKRVPAVPGLTVLFCTVVAGTLADDPQVWTEQISPLLFFPPIAALVVAPHARWIVFSTLGTYSILLARAGFSGVYTAPLKIGIVVSLLAGMYCARLLTDRAMARATAAVRDATEAAAHVQRLNDRLETTVQERTADLRTALHDLQQQMAVAAAQHRIIQQLSLPLLRIGEHTMLLPLVGDLTALSQPTMRGVLLTTIEQQRIRTLIVDATGLAMLDAPLTQQVLHVLQAVQLLGCVPRLVGIRPDVAESLVASGLTLDVTTYRSIQTALKDVSL